MPIICTTEINCSISMHIMIRSSLLLCSCGRFQPYFAPEIDAEFEEYSWLWISFPWKVRSACSAKNAKSVFKSADKHRKVVHVVLRHIIRLS